MSLSPMVEEKNGGYDGTISSNRLSCSLEFESWNSTAE